MYSCQCRSLASNQDLATGGRVSTLTTRTDPLSSRLQLAISTMERQHRASPVPIRPRDPSQPHGAYDRIPLPPSRLIPLSSAPMSIRGAREPSPPPALPPPRYIPDLAAGNDLGWQWGNQSEMRSWAPRAASPSSSVFGRTRFQEEEDTSLQALDFQRRRDSVFSVKSQAQSSMSGYPGHDPTYGSLSGSSFVNQLVTYPLMHIFPFQPYHPTNVVTNSLHHLAVGSSTAKC